MSLLIKALKQAEARHREATAEAIAQTAADPTAEQLAASAPRAAAVAAPAREAMTAPARSEGLSLSLDDAPMLRGEPTLSLSIDEAVAPSSPYPPVDADAAPAQRTEPADVAVAAAPPQGAPAAAAVAPPQAPIARRAPVADAAKGAAVPAEPPSGGAGGVPPFDARPAAGGARFGASRAKMYGGLGLVAAAIGAWLGWQAFAPVTPAASPSAYSADSPGGLPATGMPTPSAAAAPASEPPASAAQAVPASAPAPAPTADTTAPRAVAKQPAPLAKTPSRAAAAPATTEPAARAPAAAAASTAPTAVAPTAAAPAAPAAAPAATPASPPAAGRGGVRLQRDTSGDRITQLVETGYAALARHDDKVAKKAYDEALALDANNGDAWVGLGTLAARANDPVRAERHFARALEIDPNDPAARAGVLALRGTADAVSQESSLRNLIADDESQPSHHFALGNALASQGRWLDAQQAYFTAFTLDPKHPDHAFNLAVSLERIRQPKAAVEYYEKSLTLAEARPARFDRAAARARIAALQGAAER